MFIPEGYASISHSVSWLGELAAERKISGLIGEIEVLLGVGLASQKIRGVAINEEGDLITIPPAFWRTKRATYWFENWETSHFQFVGLDNVTHRGFAIAPICELATYFPEIGLPTTPPTIWPDDWGTTPFDETFASSLKAANKSAGGRPPVHNWEDFWIEVVRFVDKEGLAEEHRPLCQKHMEDWTARNMPNAPTPSTIRSKLTRLYPARLTSKG
jgi:hypothetical protein